MSGTDWMFGHWRLKWEKLMINGICFIHPYLRDSRLPYKGFCHSTLGLAPKLSLALLLLSNIQLKMIIPTGTDEDRRDEGILHKSLIIS